MFLNPQTYQVQSNFANYCRTGIVQEIKGTNPERLKHYRRLVYNIINDSLQSAYPLTFQLLTEQEWDELVNEFFTEHPCQSPQVWWMPKEFYEYIVANKQALINKYPFLPNLLEMEWLEVELFMMEDITADYRSGDFNHKDKLVLNPELRIRRFDYPVHLKNSSQIEKADYGNYFLVMHREPTTGKVIFTDVSVFFALMIEILIDRPCTSDELISTVCSDFKLKVNDTIIQESEKFIQNAMNNQLIIGFTN